MTFGVASGYMMAQNDNLANTAWEWKHEAERLERDYKGALREIYILELKLRLLAKIDSSTEVTLPQLLGADRKLINRELNKVARDFGYTGTVKY